MKHLITLILVIIVVAQGFSQDQTYKPEGGDWNAEVNFDPFGSSPIDISYLRARMFSSSNSAIRLGVSIAGESRKPDDDIKLSTFTINLRPGYEYHFGGTDRLSPYIGGELDFAIKSSKFTDDANDAEITGAWDAGGSERGFTRIGLNAVMGVDFYIVKHLYLGTEIGYGFELINEKDIEFDPDFGDNTIDGGSTFQFGPNFNSSIRLGFIF